MWGGVSILFGVKFLVGHYYILKESLEQPYTGTAERINTTMKKCTRVWSIWRGRRCFIWQDSITWFSLSIATVHAIFKSTCSASRFALQYAIQPYCSLQSGSEADAALKQTNKQTKNHATREQESSLDFSNAFALWERSFWKEEIQLGAASIFLDGRPWQEARDAKMETWNAFGSHGMAWIKRRANYF